MYHTFLKVRYSKYHPVYTGVRNNCIRSRILILYAPKQNPKISFLNEKEFKIEKKNEMFEKISEKFLYHICMSKIRVKGQQNH